MKNTKTSSPALPVERSEDERSATGGDLGPDFRLGLMITIDCISDRPKRTRCSCLFRTERPSLPEFCDRWNQRRRFCRCRSAKAKKPEGRALRF